MKTLFQCAVAGLALSFPCIALASIDILTEDIVVTPTRFDASLESLAVGVTVIEREQIEASRVRTVAEALSVLGGVHSRDNTGRPSPQLDLRGFGVTGDQNTLVLVNGQRISENELLPANVASIPLAAVERIEILRSGGAVLYGGGATGGTINIITRAPRPYSRSGAALAGAGSYDAYTAQARAELSGEHLGLRLGVLRDDTDNYRRNNANRQDSVSATLRLARELDRWNFSFGRDRQETRLPGALSESQIAVDRRAAAFPDDQASLDTDFASLGWLRSLDGVEFGADATYRGRDATGSVSGGSSAARGRTVLLSPRARVRGVLFGQPHMLVLGLDWENWEYDTLTAFPGFDSDAASVQKNGAIYALDTWEPRQGSTLTLGARAQRSRTRINERSTFSPASSLSRTDGLKAYELALRQQLVDRLSLYFRAGNSFRLATVDENRGRPVPLAPQTSRDREVALEYDGAGYWARAAAYRLNVSNEIHFMFIPGGVFGLFGANVNLPPTRHEGAELGAGMQFASGVRLQVRYEWRRARFLEGLFGGTDVQGNEIPLVPRHLASALLTWRPTEHWSIGASARYVGEQRFDNDQSNTFGSKMPAYVVADVKASRHSGRWVWTLAINNLFAEEYFSYGILNGAGTSFSAYPAPERNLFLTAEYRFGR
ncbi:MAG TPA: TonB-dependent receptor [Burkholderiales bacterium]|jgi:iron complex outermembrane receptor protein|nr:TonB-dependent receptor [Burkholderiales bacterium]